jgi:hypothetical protein
MVVKGAAGLGAAARDLQSCREEARELRGWLAVGDLILTPSWLDFDRPFFFLSAMHKKQISNCPKISKTTHVYI